MCLRLILGAALLTAAPLAAPAPAQAATDIDLLFPAPAGSRQVADMQRLIDAFNKDHSDTRVTLVNPGGYYEADRATRRAIRDGHAPALTLMYTDFIQGYIVEGALAPMEELVRADGQTADQFLNQFWPALRQNQTGTGHIYDVPFQLATPLMYYNIDAFKAAGLNPDRPPATWKQWVDAAKKLTVRDADGVSRWGVMIPETADWCGWTTSALAMSNGGAVYSTRYAGTVYYTEPGMIGAVRFLDSLVHRFEVMPEGVPSLQAVSTAFFEGKAAMVVMSTDTLPLVREHMKTPFRTAAVPAAMYPAAPVTGASFVIPKSNTPERQAAAWALIKYLSSPEIAGGWARGSGYLAPSPAAYEQPAMKEYLAQHPDAKPSVEQLAYARGWFSSFRSTTVRMALEDGVQAVISGKATPQAAMQKAQSEAESLMRPYVERTALKLPD